MKPGYSAGKGLALQYMRGFSMIEVLMALLVITFGLLGVAGMQAVSVGNTSTAGYRSIAALEAQSIASAMSANPVYWQNPSVAVPATTTVALSGSSITATAAGGATAYNYTGSATLTSLTNPPASNYTATCQANACTSPASLAQYDIILWGYSLNTSLPGGTGKITCTPATTTVLASCEIYISWTEKVLTQNQAAAANSSATGFDFEMAVVP